MPKKQRRLQKKTAPKKATGKKTSAPPAPSDLAALAGTSDDAVKARTGRTWEQWVRLLDRAGATSMPHREIAAYIHRTFDISGWWAQTVTVGYERIRGLREVGQRRGGTYEVSKSKTFPVPIARLYRAFAVARTRARWLPGVKLTVRKATPERSVRITWEDGTSVEACFTAKGEAKSQVAVQHQKLATRADATQKRAYWTERLAALAELLARSR